MLNKYKTIILDCDGVILNSNKIKSNAFYDIAKPYGEKEAMLFLEYHINNGGISRNVKIDYLLNTILNIGLNEELKNQLLNNFQSQIFNNLLNSNVAENLGFFCKKYSNKKLLVVSGGNEKELIQIFKHKYIYQYFNSGIYGSPKSKEKIFTELIANKTIIFPAIYIGDSKNDQKNASDNGIDFVFIHEWTEVDDWKKFCISKNIKFKKNLNQLI